jgi:hypothetical protein
MLTSVPGALVKEANIVKFSWKLCNQPLKIEKYVFLCRMTLVSMTLKIIIILNSWMLLPSMTIINFS